MSALAHRKDAVFPRAPMTGICRQDWLLMMDWARAGKAILVVIMKMRIAVTLSVAGFLLAAGASSHAAPDDSGALPRQAGGQLSFDTLDDDVEQISAAQIWRVRSATSRSEPAGAIVIDYGFDRLFVKDTLDNVVAKIRAQRELRQFTMPSGGPIYIAPDRITGVSRPIPNQHHQNAGAVILLREGEQQQVRETRQAVTEVIK